MSIKKRIKPGKIEPSVDGTAIVVHFTTEITHLTEDGETEFVEKHPEFREVPVSNHVRGLRPEEIPALAQEVIERCRYIPASKAKQVEQVLSILCTSRDGGATISAPTGHDSDRYRQQRGAIASRERGERGSERRRRQGQGLGNTGVPSAGQSDVSERWIAPSSTNGSSVSPSRRPVDLLPWATADSIDDYTEALYEDDMEAKATGAEKLLRLSCEADLLVEISKHSTLLGVLSRELRENAKRSHQLAVAITGIFLCLAHFSQFHASLTRHQCGEVTMKVVEYESRRRSMLSKELKLQQGQLVARGSAVSAEERRKFEKEEHRYRGIFERQDRLLLLCLLTLRHLSEDPGVERGFVKQKLLNLLVHMLGRASEDLLCIVLAMLHKLSIIQNNNEHLVQSTDALSKLAELCGHSNTEVALMALRTCYNLSFDHRGRSTFCTQTALPAKLQAACQQGFSKKVLFKTLYQLTTDRRSRNSLASRAPGLITLALQNAVKSRDSQVDVDTAALLLNLAADEACCAVLVKSDGFAKAAVRAIQGADPLMLKVLRLTASHASCRKRFLSVMRGAGRDVSFEWLPELVHLAAGSCDRPEILVEAIGTMAALECNNNEVAWADLCAAGLLELLHRLLMVGFSEDDVLLECVILVGTLALDADCVPLLAPSKIPRLLADLFHEKQDDAEMVVQMLFVVRCLLLQEETCKVMLRETDVIEQTLDLLRSQLGEVLDAEMQSVQAAADHVLDLVLAEPFGETTDYADDIKAFRFEAHNFEWCRSLDRGDSHQDHRDHHHFDPSKTFGVERRGWADVGSLSYWGAGGFDRTSGAGFGGGGFDGYKSTRHR
mmetsp:Transcript_73740/g.213606  ORF Transcript_73740/g.213606 Transcript_73740/m.213606 type:complete len:836 (-) Transcript_73740:169-2676(-)